MSFFSVVELAPGVRLMSREMRTLSRCGEAYRDHQLLWRLFRDDDRQSDEKLSDERRSDGLEDVEGSSETRDFIFRRRTEVRSTLSYYVVSAREPKPASTLLSVKTKRYDPRLHAGDLVAFDLRANPVVSRKRSGASGSGHHDVLMDAKFSARSDGSRTASEPDPPLAWLAERAARWGLKPHLESVIASAPTRNRLKPGERDIIFTTLDYTGLALVTDSDLLRAALIEGVGKKRGFGCGLLLVRRAD